MYVCTVQCLLLLCLLLSLLGMMIVLYVKHKEELNHEGLLLLIITTEGFRYVTLEVFEVDIVDDVDVDNHDSVGKTISYTWLYSFTK